MWDNRPGSCQAHSGKFARCCPYTVGAITCRRRHSGVHSTWQITCLIWIYSASTAVYPAAEGLPPVLLPSDVRRSHVTVPLPVVGSGMSAFGTQLRELEHLAVHHAAELLVERCVISFQNCCGVSIGLLSNQVAIADSTFNPIMRLRLPTALQVQCASGPRHGF